MTLPDVLHFQSIPWCAKLLADPRFTAAPIGSRSPKRSTEDSFFAETLQTDKTIRACLSLYCIPSPPSCDSAPSPRIQEVRTLISLGSGVNGHPHIAHGGFLATLLDEGQGILTEANKDNGSGRDNGNATVTAYLNVKYRRPVPTPGVVLVTAKYTKVVPRKQFIRATVEDGEGTVYAEAEALFVEIKEKL